VSHYPGETPVPWFRSKVKCAKCGGHGNKILMSNFEQISFRHPGSISGTYRGVASPKVRWLRPLPVDGAAGIWGGKNMPGAHRSDTLSELAAECVTLAERTIDPDIRVELLLIAQKWIAMANGRLAITELSDETSLVPK
jgi:hypothetical protein